MTAAADVKRVLISGSTGLIGRSLTEFLELHGWRVVRLFRTRAHTNLPDRLFWDPDKGEIDNGQLSGLKAVVHLAGENLMGRWTDTKKEEIRSSRIDGTGFLAKAIATVQEPPPVFISASAIGVYGNRADEVLTETAESGHGFLAEVCREWEAATAPAADAGIRVSNARFGVVLSEQAGALAQMLPIFRLGLGGRLGSGSQYVSWVSLSDAVRAVSFLISDCTLAGPINVTSPEPVTNAGFTSALSDVLNRPAAIHVPEFALRLRFGEMADELLLSSTRAIPQRLLEAGYHFEHRQIREALGAVVAR